MIWWLVAAVVAAVVAVPAVTLAGTSQARTEGRCPRASDDVVKVLDQRIAAINRGDGKAAAALYARRGVLVELDAAPDAHGTPVFKGRSAIAKRLQYLHDAGLRLRSIGCPVQLGREVTGPTGIWVKGPGGMSRQHPADYMLVYEFNARGKIAYEWVTGGTGLAR